MGLGRGKYVGFGPHSHWFNTDMLFVTTNQHELLGRANEDAFGLFFGSSWKIIDPLSLMLEFDGRDVNAGLSYKFTMIDLNLAWTHIEQVGKSHRPRISIGASVSSFPLPKRVEYASISIRVFDNESGEPLTFNVNLEGGKTSKTLQGKKGKIKMKLLPGEYVMKVVIPGYKWKQIKLVLKEGETRAFKLGLEKKPTEEELAKEKEFDVNFVNGVTSLNNGKYKNAVAYLEKCLLLKPGDEEATSYYEKAREAFRRQFDALKIAAEALENNRNYKGALGKYKELLVIDESNAEIAAKIDQLTKRLRPKKETPKVVKPPATPGVTDADINKWYNQGLSYFSSGNYKKAITMFEKVLRYRKSHSGARKYLGKARTRLKALGG